MDKLPIAPQNLEDVIREMFDLSDASNSEDGAESSENEEDANFTEVTSNDLLTTLIGSPIANSAEDEDLSALRPSTSSVTSNISFTQSVLTPNTQESDLETVDYESDGSEADVQDKLWKKTELPQTTTSRDFDRIPLKSTQLFPSRSSPGAYFNIFFSEEVLTIIITQTNLYAQQNNQRNWEPIQICELKAFFGILILMGIHRLPNYALYWSSDPFFCVQEIANVMTVKRFRMIMRNLHVNNNENMPKRGEDNYDKLYKIRPLINALNTAFQNGASNTCSQSIDECMIKFKGRSSLKQYMPKKPIKRGFKVWARCDSATGYIYQFEIYTGKKDECTETGLGASVVKNFCQPLINEKLEDCHVTFDNFFASCELMQYLYDNNIFSTATVRQDRVTLPAFIKKPKKKNKKINKKENDLPVLESQSVDNEKKFELPKLKKGERKWRVNKNVGFVIWRDTKLVYVLTTAYEPKLCSYCKRTQKDGRKEKIKCPIAVLQYTKRMGGVDRFDQKRGTYNVSRRNRRWWMRILYFLLDAAITNSYTLYTRNSRVHNPMNHLHFRTTLARNLINGYSSRKRTAINMAKYIVKKRKTSIQTNPNRQKNIYGIPDEIRLADVGCHMPAELPTYLRCKECSTKANSKKSKYQCTKCGVTLCIVPCFAKFHTA